MVRVHPEVLDRQRIPDAAHGSALWDRRYREINDWERHLTDNGFKVVKVFLNLSKEEQRTRFLKRIDLPEKNWKFSGADVRERKYWDDYQEAFAEMLSATSTPWAPWYVVPHGPEVVRADLRRGRPRPHPDRDRPPLPGRRRGGPAGPAGRPATAEEGSTEGCARRPVRGPARAVRLTGGRDRRAVDGGGTGRAVGS